MSETNKELLQQGLELILQAKKTQEGIRHIARCLGDGNSLKMVSGRKRFRLGNVVLVLEYHPNARSTDRRWNLIIEEVENVG